MKTLISRLWAILATTALAVSFGALSLSADGHGKKTAATPSPMSFVEWTSVDPAHEEAYQEAWKEIRDMAVEMGYRFPTQMAQFRNQYYWITPISSYADLDAMFANRQKVYDEGGENFANAVNTLNNFTLDRQTWVSHYNSELSYLPTGAVPSEDWGHMDINIYEVKYGHGEDAEKLMRDIKALYSDLDIRSRYNVFESGIGERSNTLVVISYFKDPLDAAAAREATQAKLSASERWQDLFAQFRSHVRETEYLYASPRRDLALIPTPEQ